MRWAAKQALLRTRLPQDARSLEWQEHRPRKEQVIVLIGSAANSLPNEQDDEVQHDRPLATHLADRGSSPTAGSAAQQG